MFDFKPNILFTTHSLSERLTGNNGILQVAPIVSLCPSPLPLHPLEHHVMVSFYPQNSPGEGSNVADLPLTLLGIAQ